jgi:hypothetical protein
MSWNGSHLEMGMIVIDLMVLLVEHWGHQVPLTHSTLTSYHPNHLSSFYSLSLDSSARFEFLPRWQEQIGFCGFIRFK